MGGVLSHVQQGLIAKAHYVPHVVANSDLLLKKPLFRPDGYGHAAVVVFFVLSGFLVGGKLIELVNSENLGTDWTRFFVDRFARIFVVLWPTLFLTAAVFLALVHFLPDAPFVSTGGWTYALSAPVNGDLNAGKWALIAVLLNELLAPTLTSNSPLWSLSYEWSYYMIAMAAVLAYRRHLSVGSVAMMLYGTALFLLAARNQPDLLFAGISWLAGVGARLVSNHDMLRGRVSRLAGIVAVLAVLAADHRHPLPDPVLGIALALMIAHCKWKQLTFAKNIGDRLASFSYSLYLTHFPMLLAIMGVLHADGRLPHPMKAGVSALAIAFATSLCLLLFARAFAWATEDRTVVIRSAMLGLIGASYPRRQSIAPNPRTFGVKK